MSSTNPVSHVKITTASLIALVTTIVGAVCAIVPQWSTDKQIIIAALTAVITAVPLIVNSIHALAGSKLTLAAAERDVKTAVHAELQRILAKGLEPAPPPDPQPPAPPVALAQP